MDTQAYKETTGGQMTPVIIYIYRTGLAHNNNPVKGVTGSTFPVIKLHQTPPCNNGLPK